MLLCCTGSDLYGWVLWDLSHFYIDDICFASHKDLMRALGLPWHTHSALLAPVTISLPLRDELFCRTAMFVSKCVHSENSIVTFVSLHAVYSSRVNSPIGLNAQLCCSHFNLPLSRLTSISRNFVQQSSSPVKCTLLEWLGTCCVLKTDRWWFLALKVGMLILCWSLCNVM